MHIWRFWLFCLAGSLLVLVGGCGRSGMWSFTLENHSMEHYLNVNVAFRDEVCPTPSGGDGFGPAGRVHMGVTGRMPDAVDVSFTTKDGLAHKVHVLIPDAAHKPGVGNTPPVVFLIIESRDKVTAADIDPESGLR